MSRLNSYILVRLLGPFGFFLLIFTGIIWLTQAIRLIDTVLNNGQSALVFVEFSGLLLPRVLVIVIPIAAFSAALYTINRLYADSELVVMLAAGESPFKLLKPIAIFGFVVMVITYLVTLYLVPLSATRLAERTFEIQDELTNALIVEGRFLHPTPGVTFFIQDTSKVGEMRGLFLNDQTDPSGAITYSAQKALLARDGDLARLIMFDGIAQRYQPETQRMDTVQFEQLAYDLSPMMEQSQARAKKPVEYYVGEVLGPEGPPKSERFRVGHYLSEAHEKLTTPLLALTLPLVTLGSVLFGGFRRGGVGSRITAAVVILIAMELLTIVMKSAIRSDGSVWPLAYIPPLVTLGIALGLVWLASRSKQQSRKQIAGPAT